MPQSTARSRVDGGTLKQILLLKASGATGRQIETATGVKADTAMKLCKRYQLASAVGGLAALEHLTPDEVAACVYKKKAQDNLAIYLGLRSPVDDYLDFRTPLRPTISLSQAVATFAPELKKSQAITTYRRWQSGLERHPGEAVNFLTPAPGALGLVATSRLILSLGQGKPRSPKVQIFLAILPASGFAFATPIAAPQSPSRLEAEFTYAKAWLDKRGIAEWVAAHERWFEALGGVPRAIVCANNMSRLVEAVCFDKDWRWSYAEFAGHHGARIAPLRNRTKAARQAKYHRRGDAELVQSALLAEFEEWLTPLLTEVHFRTHRSLEKALAEHCARWNSLRFPGLQLSISELYERADRPALHPRKQLWPFRQIVSTKLGVDNHVSLFKTRYSIPSEISSNARRRAFRKWRKRGAIYLRFIVSRDEIVLINSSLILQRQKDGRYHTDPDHLLSTHRPEDAAEPKFFFRNVLFIGDVGRSIGTNTIARYEYPEYAYPELAGMLQQLAPLHRAKSALEALRTPPSGYDRDEVFSHYEDWLRKAPFRLARHPEDAECEAILRDAEQCAAEARAVVISRGRAPDFKISDLVNALSPYSPWLKNTPKKLRDRERDPLSYRRWENPADAFEWRLGSVDHLAFGEYDDSDDDVEERRVTSESSELGQDSPF